MVAGGNSPLSHGGGRAVPPAPTGLPAQLVPVSSPELKLAQTVFFDPDACVLVALATYMEDDGTDPSPFNPPFVVFELGLYSDLLLPSPSVPLTTPDSTLSDTALAGPDILTDISLLPLHVVPPASWLDSATSKPNPGFAHYTIHDRLFKVSWLNRSSLSYDGLPTLIVILLCPVEYNCLLNMTNRHIAFDLTEYTKRQHHYLTSDLNTKPHVTVYVKKLEPVRCPDAINSSFVDDSLSTFAHNLSGKRTMDRNRVMVLIHTMVFVVSPNIQALLGKDSPISITIMSHPPRSTPPSASFHMSDSDTNMDAPSANKRFRDENGERTLPPRPLPSLESLITDFSTDPIAIQAALYDLSLVFDTCNRVFTAMYAEDCPTALSLFTPLFAHDFVKNIVNLTPLLLPLTDRILTSHIPPSLTDDVAALAAAQVDLSNTAKQNVAAILELTRTTAGLKIQVNQMDRPSASWLDAPTDYSPVLRGIQSTLDKLVNASSANRGDSSSKRKATEDPEPAQDPKKKQKKEAPTSTTHVISIEEGAKHAIRDNLDAAVFAQTFTKAVTRIEHHSPDDLRMLFGIGMNVSGNVTLTVSPKMTQPFTDWTIRLLTKHLNQRSPDITAVRGATKIVQWTKLVITGMPARNAAGMTRDKDDLLSSLKNNATFSPWIGNILLGPRWLSEDPMSAFKPSILIGFEDPEGRIKEKIFKTKGLFVDFMQVSVKEYVPRPSLRQCLKCFNFGHQTFTCRRELVCPFCSSEEHDGTTHCASCNCASCSLDDPLPSGCLKKTCPLCHSHHDAYYKECPTCLKAWAKLKSKTTDKDGFMEVGSSNGKRPPTRNAQSRLSDKEKGKKAIAFSSLNSLPAGAFPIDDLVTESEREGDREPTPKPMDT